MTLLDRVPYIRQLWTALLPSVQQPSDEFAVKWAFDFSDREIEYALVRASKKFHHQTLEPIVVHKYVSGVLQNEHEKHSDGYAKWERHTASRLVETR
jgi:hypothetical protein